MLTAVQGQVVFQSCCQQEGWVLRLLLPVAAVLLATEQEGFSVLRLFLPHGVAQEALEPLRAVARALWQRVEAQGAVQGQGWR